MDNRFNGDDRTPSATSLRSLRDAEDEARTKGRKLNNADRLWAARTLSLLWSEAKTRGLRQSEIEDRVRQRLIEHQRVHKGSEEFRLKRWLLSRDHQEITPAVIRQYQNRPTPQKDLHVYFVAVAVLADALGRQPDEEKLRMLASLRRVPRDNSHSSSLDLDIPGENLAVVLRALTRAVVADSELPSICDRLGQLGFEWNPHLERLHLAQGRDSVRRPSRNGYQAGAAIHADVFFPYPSVPVIGHYYGSIDGEASIVPSDPPIPEAWSDELSAHPAFARGARPDEPKSGWVPSRFHVYRRVSLQIQCESDREPVPVFVSRADIFLDTMMSDQAGGSVEDRIRLLGALDIYHSLEPFHSEYADLYGTPVGFFRDNRWHHVFARFTNVRKPRARCYDDPDDFPSDPLQGTASPHEPALFWSQTPATAPYIRAWLVDAEPAFGEAPIRPLRLEGSGSGESVVPWSELNFPTDGPARDLEIALHEGRVEAALHRQIATLKYMTDSLEANWLEGRERGTQALLRRWHRPHQ